MQAHAAAVRILALVRHQHKELPCGIWAPDRSQFADQDVTRRLQLQPPLVAERAKQKTLREVVQALFFSEGSPEEEGGMAIGQTKYKFSENCNQ
ncbi:Semaphorin-6C [Manis pentadactyla]|nr:Semaphorin-6C [Manis pentadactyla]